MIGCAGLGCLPFTAIVAAILFPVFAQARAKARQTVCMQHERILAVSLLSYVQDYDDHLPPAAKWQDAVASMVSYTPPNGQKDDLYHCPAATETQAGSNYAFDSRIGGKSLRTLAEPEQKMMLYDSTAGTHNASDPGTSLPVPGRHSHGNNIAYADAHAKWVPARSPADAEPN